MRHPIPYKVLQIIPQFSVGGRERVVYSITSGIDRETFQPYLVSLRGSRPAKDLFPEIGAPIYSLNKRVDGFDLSVIKKLRSFIVNHQIDIVHTHNPGTFIYGGIAAKLAGAKVVVNTEHGYSYSISWKKKWIEDFLRKRINATIAVSEALRSQICSISRFSPPKVVVIRNGINAERFQNPVVDPGLRNEVRGQYNIVIGTVGRLDPVKNHETLLHAFSTCFQKRKDIRLVFIGDGAMRSYLEKKSTSLGLTQHVMFLGNRAEIPQILSVLDIFALPSLSEGLSITLLEAMAAGKPVIASNVGGNKEVINDGEDGLLIPPNAPDLLAQTLLTLINSPGKRELLAKRAQEKVKNCFSEEKMVKAVVRLYLEQLNKVQ